MRLNRALAVLVLLAVAGGALERSGRAQTPAQAPAPPASAPAQTPDPQTFRAGTTLVRVDVYPRRDGRVVEGLKAEDFQVFEDGKAQTIATFEVVKVPLNPTDAERRDPVSVEDGNRQVADPHNRVFVIYLDLFHVTVSGSHASQTPVVSFLARTIGATDLFAVMTPDTPVSTLTFGRRTETVEGELSKYWTWGESDRAMMFRDDAENRLAVCTDYGGDAFTKKIINAYREDKTATHLERLISRLGELRDERKNLLLLSEGWVPEPPFGGPVAVPGGGGVPAIGTGPDGKIAVGGYTGSRAEDAFDPSWCNTQISHLAGIDFERRFNDLLDLARRANVSFYPIDVGGLKTDMAPASSRGLAQPQMALNNTLRTLAENTDGRAVVGTNDVTRAMQAISEDVSSYYLLSYNSTNPASDGRFRRIEVKVGAPNVKVTARRGYVASTAAERRAEDAAAARAATGPAPIDGALATLGKLRSDATFYTYAAASATDLTVVAEIASRETDAGRWKDGATVAVSATATAAGSTSTVTAEGRIEPGARSTLITIPLGPTTIARTWRITTKVRGSDGVLDDGIDAPTDPNPAIGAPVIFRAGSSLRSPVRVTAEPLFSRTERVHVEWPVTMGGTRTVRLLGRRGDVLPIPIAVSERDGRDGGVVVMADLSLSPIAQGDYAMEITTKNGADTVTRLFAFRVAR